MSIDTQTLRAFHNDPAVKIKYLARVDDHIAADDLVRGATGRDGKGCAVWCTLDAYDHSRYPVELGIPEWLAKVEDTLFEGMSVEKSKTWPRDFLNAIELGVDLERAKAPFLLVVLRSTLRNFDHTDNPEFAAAVQGAIALWERSDVGTPDWESAARSAESAAWSAASAARSAARSAESAVWSAWSAESAALSAESAVWSAWSAESAALSAAWSAASSAAKSAGWSVWSAESAVWSAESAAESAAWSAESVAYDSFADALILILRGLEPVAETTPTPSGSIDKGVEIDG